MPLVSGLTSAILSKQASDYATDMNVAMNRENNAFNARQADIARQFEAGQAALTRNYNSAEAQKARDFNAAEALKARNFNQIEALKERQFSATEAQKVRDYEERMSNTAYQRAFADAQAAGINPVAALLGSGGASSPSVSAASGYGASSGAASGGAASSSSARGVAANSSGFAGAKTPDFSGIANMGNGLASLAQSAVAVKTLKSLGNAKTVADVSKILTSAKTAKSLASLVKFLV